MRIYCFITADNIKVGVIRIVDCKDDVDYLISIGDQESEQDSEEQNTQTADEFNFDNTYAEYMNDEDDGYDDVDDEEEYFGLSM